MVGSCQSGKKMKKKKKVDGDFRPYFQNWVHPRRRKANCVVRSEWEGERGRERSVATAKRSKLIMVP